MKFEQNKRLSFIQRLTCLLALFCFIGLFVFSPILHAHELGLEHTQDDCASCHWAQNHTCDTASSIRIIPIQAYTQLFPENNSPESSINSSHFPIRAPPKYS